jgi:TolA-binding protein
MSTPALLDRVTLEAQMVQLTTNHKELVERLSAHNQRAAELQRQLDGTRIEIEQFKGALSYSQHVQEQVKKALEQSVAAEMAAKLAEESAAKASSA